MTVLYCKDLNFVIPKSSYVTLMHISFNLLRFNLASLLLSRNFVRLWLDLGATQRNYATQDSSGMCHLMPQRHLPEWREEKERAFVHSGIQV